MTALPAASAFTGPVTQGDFKTAHDALIGYLGGLLGTTGTVATALATLGALAGAYMTKVGAYSVVAADRGKVIDATTGSWTLSLPAVSGLSGFSFLLRNSGAGTITLDGSGAEQVDGAATLAIGPGCAVLVICTGTAWVTHWMISPDGTATFTNKSMSVGQITGLGALATLNLIDFTFMSGSGMKEPVRVIADSNIVIATGTLLTVDGYTLLAGDRILLIGQTSSPENGIYIAGTGAWVRATDADSSAEIAGSFVSVIRGTTYGGTQWGTSFKGGTVVGTANQFWFRIMRSDSVLLAAQMPAFTGDVTNVGLAMTITDKPAFGQLIADYTLTSTTSLQKAFNWTTNGALTLTTGVYVWEAMIDITGMSATSGNALFDVLGVGTATLNHIMDQVIGSDASNPLNANTLSGELNTTKDTPASMVAAGIGTGLGASRHGMFDLTGPGTIIPSVQLVTAIAAVMKQNSFFRCTRIAPTGTNVLGAWT